MDNVYVSIKLSANTIGTDVQKITFFEYLVEGSVSSLVSVDEDGKPVVPDNCVAMDASTY